MQHNQVEHMEELVHDWTHCFRTFNRNHIIEELTRAFERKNTIHLEISTEILNYSRRYGELPEFLVSPILRDLKNQEISQTVRRILAQAVKYAVKKKLDVQYEELLGVFEGNCAEIKSEVVRALAYKVENSAQRPSQELIDRMKIKMTKDVDPEAKSFLESQIAQDDAEVQRPALQENFKNTGSLNQNSMRRVQAMPTRNQQVVSVINRINQSQQSQLEITSITNAMRSQKKTVKANPKIEKLHEGEKIRKGSNVSWIDNTYQSAKNLYKQAMDGNKLLTDQDENFLREKFLDGTKFFTPGVLGDLVTDRMIAATLKLLSNKHLLAESTIDKLLVCLSDPSHVGKYYYKNQELKDFIQDIFSSEIPEPSNDIEQKISASMREKSEGEENQKQFLFQEIACLRRDAISALYECALQDKKVLTYEYLAKVRGCLGDKQDMKVRGMAVRILATFDNQEIIDKNEDKATIYKAVFSTCLSQLKENIEQELEQSLDYIDQQSKDSKRCQELFTEEVVELLSSFLNNPSYIGEFKKDCNEILQNYLKHSWAECFKLEVLQNICSTLKNLQAENELKEQALISILFAAEKKKELPDLIIEFLMETLQTLNEDSDRLSLIIIIFGTICDQENTKIECVERISSKLLDDRFVIAQGRSITFKEFSSENSLSPTLSAISAKIIMSFIKKGNAASHGVVNNLIQALARDNDQTRILVAKTFSFASDQNLLSLNRDLLTELEDYIKDDIPDVAIYIIRTFTNIYSILSKETIIICPNHMNILATIYLDQELQLDDEDFSAEIKKKILSILGNQAERQEFTESVFDIFEQIFIFDDPYKKEALDIMKVYTGNQNRIPEIPDSTILAIENMLRTSDFEVQALDILEKVAENGQIISDKILDVLNDNLYKHNEKEEIGNQSLRVLQIAHRNQDLPDRIFESIDLTIAGFGLGPNAADFEKALEFLEMQTKAEKKLPSSVFKTLSQHLENLQALSILINVSTNRQHLPEFLILEMFELFQSGKNKDELVKIFFNIAKNHQTLEFDLFGQLEKMFDDTDNSDETLMIFVYRAQKGEKVSSNLIERISHKYLHPTNQPLKQECFFALVSIIQNHQDLSQEKAETVLTKGLDDENEHIVRASLKGFDLISAKTIGLNQKSIEALISKAEQSSCSNKLKEKIKKLLDSQVLNQNQEARIFLATLSSKEKVKFLLNLAQYVEDGHSIEPKLDEIVELITEPNVNIQKSAIQLLLIYIKNNKMPDNLIDSVATLMFSTSSKELSDQCLELMKKIAESGQKISKKAIYFVYALPNSNEVLKVIKKNPEIPECVELSSQIDSMPSSAEPWELTLRLKKIINLDSEFKMTEDTLKNLVSLARDCQKKEDNANLEEFALVFSRALLQGFEFQIEMIEAIEKAIGLKKIHLNIVQAYRKIIQSKKFNNLSKSLDSLIEFLLKRRCKCEKEEDMISLEIYSCVASASILEEFCPKGHLLMEAKINDPNPNIREKCFQGLHARQNKGFQSIVFKGYCDELLKKLNDIVQIQGDLEPSLLETLASLKYWNHGKLKETLASLESWDHGQLKEPSQKYLIRELILSDLLTRLDAKDFEKLTFYKEWLETEAFLKSQGLDSNKILKALASCSRLMLEDIVEIFRFLPEIDLDNVKDILWRSLNPFQELKQKWLASLLTGCLKSQEVNKRYLDWFASNISSKLTTSLNSKLFAALSKVEKFSDLESLKIFVAENNINDSDIALKGASILKLKRSLEIKVLSSRIQSSINYDKLATILDNLREKDWSFEKLMEMFKKVESHSSSERKIKEESLIQILESLVHYKISATFSRRILEILDRKVGEWIKKMNEVAIEINFQANPKVKNPVDLVEKLKRDNTDNASLQDFIKNNRDLPELVGQIQKTKLSSYVRTGPAMSTLLKAEILSWAKKAQSNQEYWAKPDSLRDALFRINDANAFHTGFLLNNAQILSCIILLNTKLNQGRLLQVGTGEGKSTIVSVVAIIQALQGKKVDIITSSQVLAKRDASEKVGLYKMFDLSCTDNGDNPGYVKGPKNCYKQDIVYGEIAQFQFDTLRDEYNLLETLAGRKCEVAIIDEVDCMLIDESTNIARLSSPISGVDLLQPFIHLLWHRLHLLEQRLFSLNEKMYLLYDQAAQIPNVKKNINNMTDLNEVAFEIEGDIVAFLKQQLVKYLSEDLLKENKIPVPSNFQEFVKNQIPKWVDNAIRALVYQQNRQYIIQDGVIKPVAYDSTGVVQNAMSWGDGLHPSVQRKHGLKMMSEAWTTNFISTSGYLKRYGDSIYGVTGTFGSKVAQRFLSNGNKLNLVKAPSLYKKRYLQMQTIISKNQSEWLEEICESALRETNLERGVLIICQTIEHCHIIAQKLAEIYREGAIKLYTMNNMNQERDIDKINPGEIIVATNLAGRGTDIKAKSIEKNGGLHVILTFLPLNQRVEDQAFGRTARQDNCGTGLMILNQAELFGYKDASPGKIKEMRDNLESEMLDQVMKKELEVAATKDELFTEFCVLKKEICQKIRDKTKFHQNNPYFGSTVYETSMLSALEERWAFFLHKIENEITPLSQSQEKFKEFKNEIEKDVKDGKDGKNNNLINLIQNPFHHIIIANDRLVCNSFLHRYLTSFLEDKNKKALLHFEKAINIDPNVSGAAFVGKAWLAIKTQKKGDNKKAEFTKELKNSLKPLHDEMAVLNTLQTLMQQENSNHNCALSKQLIQKASILGSYLNSVKNTLAVIKKSQRLIDITGEGLNSEKRKVTSSFYGLERNQKTKEVEQNFEKDKHFKFAIRFNDLTVFSDSANKDQGIETISEVFYSHNDISDTILNSFIQQARNSFQNSPVLDPLHYNHLAIALEELNPEEIKTLFNSDVQITDVSKDFALAELKKQSQGCLVNLERIFSGEIQNTKIDISAQAAIENLEESKDKHESFNILLKSANGTAVSLQKEILNDATLILEYPNLSFEILKNKLDNLHFQFGSLHLEISGIKSEISEALRNERIQEVQFQTGNNEINAVESEEVKMEKIETLDIEKARERIQNMKAQQIQIRIEELTRATARKLIIPCKGASFKVTFLGVKPSSIPQDSEGESVNVSFSQLNPSVAKKLISILRKANLNFALEFHSLDIQELKDVIKKASLQQEDVEITKVRKLDELFMDNVRPNLELSEFRSRGIEHLLEVSEKRFIPWRSIAIIAFVGTLQIILGGILLASVFGSSYGMALVTESLTEVIIICKAFNNRYFRWSDYLKQKAVSLALSAVSLGFAKVRVGYKEANTLLRGVQREAAEQVATEVVRNSQAVFKTVMVAGQKIKSLVVEQLTTSTPNIAVEIVKRMHQVVDYLFHFSFEIYRPDISAFIQEKVENTLKNEDIIIRQMHAVDKIRKKKSLPNKMNKIMEGILNPQKNRSQEFWDTFGTIGARLCKAILWNPATFMVHYSTGMRIIGTLRGLSQISVMMETIQSQFVRKLSEDKKSYEISELIHEICTIPPEKAQEISRILREKNVILEKSGCEYINPRMFQPQTNQNQGQNALRRARVYSQGSIPQNLNDIDFGDLDQTKKEAVLKLCENLNTYSETMDANDLNETMKPISDLITEHVIKVAESHLISSSSGLHIRSSVNSPPSQMDSNQNLSRNDLDLPIDCFQELEEQGADGQPGNLPLRNQNQDENQSITEKMRSYAQKIQYSKAAELADIFSLVSRYEIKLKMVENPDYIATEEEKKQGVKIVLYIPGERNQEENGVCHYQLLNPNEDVGKIPGQSNGCGFGVISAILKEERRNISVRELRRQLIKDIEQDPILFEKLIEAQNWAKNSGPKEIIKAPF